MKSNRCKSISPISPPLADQVETTEDKLSTYFPTLIPKHLESNNQSLFPLPGIFHPLCNPARSVLDPSSQTSQRIAHRLSGASCGTVDSTADPSSCGTRNATDGSRNTPDSVSESGGHKFSGASNAGVLRGGP
ncbi:hypothetical protein BDV29DRAFT_165430 [Aspergillus leporis]|uniref:Uncharacterized protein n=1 Tax=Aspergillus leporis TaxID=41062 RepID=A0A5N5XDK6_9EURO|nr:hypothetical protein BDV29DRAFT_165430 [Aspergillus leporis]